MKYINYLVTSKFAKGTDGHLDANSLLQAIKDHDGAEAYHNAYNVAENALGEDEGKPTFKGASGVCHPTFNLIAFDFDADDNPQLALDDVSKFIDYFGFSIYYLAFSGSKGFHLSIPFEYLGLPADEHLPRILKNLANELKTHFPTLDESVYNIGRKFRVLNSQHPKTKLYKTIVDRTWCLEEMQNFASTRQKLWYESQAWDVEPCKPLVELIDKVKASASYDKSEVGTALEPTRIEGFDGKICIKRLLENRCDEGNRNTTALIIVNDLFKTKKHKSVAYDLMGPWAERNMPADRKHEVNEIIEDIYAGRRFYNHGCLETLKAEQCSAKCSLWRKLKPDKRPTPVDAPKSAFKEANCKNKAPASRYIENWIEEHNVDVSISNLWSRDGKGMYIDLLADEIFIAYDRGELEASKYKMVTKQNITAALNIFYNKTREHKIEMLQHRITYTGDNDGVDTFLDALLPEKTELDVQVLKHWLWLVKRNIFGKSTNHHIMPILTGPSGAGKSVAVAQLLRPLGDTVDDGDIAMLGDDRNDFRLFESYVMLFDEMAKVRKLEVEILKKKITAEYLTYRVLGSNMKRKGRKVCSFIGTSNSGVQDMIKDPTSVRRYWEYLVKPLCDWKAVNNVDYLELWQGIDEEREELYIEDISALQRRQEEFRELDTIEEWLQEEELIPEVGDTGIEVTPTNAYDSYMKWLARQRRDRSAHSSTKFGKILKNWIEFGRTKSIRYYRFSSNFADQVINSPM